MTILKLLTVCSLLALAGCDTTSWGTSQATSSGPMTIPCASLSNNPPDYSKLNPQEQDRAENQPTPMC